MKPGSKLRSLAQRARLRRQPVADMTAPDRMRRRIDRPAVDELLAESTRESDIVFAMIEIDCLVPDLDLFSDSPPVHSPSVDETMLEAIGDMIARNIRPSDVVYRTNMNEYGVFINDVTMAEAAKVTTRLASAVNSLFTADVARSYSVDIGLADSRSTRSTSLVDQARLDLRSRQQGDQ